MLENAQIVVDVNAWAAALSSLIVVTSVAFIVRWGCQKVVSLGEGLVRQVKENGEVASSVSTKLDHHISATSAENARIWKCIQQNNDQIVRLTTDSARHSEALEILMRKLL